MTSELRWNYKSHAPFLGRGSWGGYGGEEGIRREREKERQSFKYTLARRLIVRR